MKEKGNTAFLVGYSTKSKGYRVYNKRTRLIVESIHLRFDEIKEISMTSVHISSGLVLHQMTSDHNSSELGIHDHSNELSRSKLVPKVVPPADKTDTSRQELEIPFHHHITMLSLGHLREIFVSTLYSGRLQYGDALILNVDGLVLEDVDPTKVKVNIINLSRKSMKKTLQLEPLGDEDRQKSYADRKRKPMEFEVGDRVMLKVSPWKGVVRFGKRGKLNPRYVGPFKVLAKVGKVAYRLELPQELSRVHHTFHVSNLKKCYADEPLVMPLEGIHVDDKLQFVEEPVEIMEREIKRLKRSRIPLVKVRWNSRRGPEFTWEREDSFKQKYPQLFTNRASSSTTRS
ncbi:hypothetical protein Tco_1246329 [Tanacetum coccineum]